MKNKAQISSSIYHLLQLLLFMIPRDVDARVVLPALFGDNMVMQQQSVVRLWGWAKPLEKITVNASWLETSIQTAADNGANWQVDLHTPVAGGPYTIEIQGDNHVVLRNVMIGEVWLCAGQSNMEWTARMGFDDAQKEVLLASYPNIRFLTIDHRTAANPQQDVSTEAWKLCTPETMIDFSAVAYFFARRLQQNKDVPIGLINASWGGTAAEAWIALDFCPDSTLVRQTASELSDVPWSPEEPASIYNAMIAPLIRYRIAGVIWYQGESNAEHVNYDPSHYYKIFPAMLTSWRNAWGYLFPFYFVQIAPYRNYLPNSGVIIRDAQRCALTLPQTGMVVTSDIGNVEDLHPGNKKDVGLRLAQLALRRHYGISNACDSGPLYRSYEVKGDRVHIFFDHPDGLYSKDDAVTHFEIAGSDKIFHSAHAIIEDDHVIVFSQHVLLPVAVRYAWSNIAEPNLFNNAHLPASCFRTDDWNPRD